MKNIHLIALLLSSVYGKAQTYQKTDLGIISNIGANKVELQFYTPSVVRVLKSPIDKPFTKKSLSVIAAPQKVAFTIAQKNDIITVKSAAIKVSLDVQTGEVIYATTNGDQLLQEQKTV